MKKHHLIRAWGLLAGLTAVSTALHLSQLPQAVTGCIILTAAWFKARLILLDYLELRGVPHWSSGLQSGLAGLIAVLTVLYLVV